MTRSMDFPGSLRLSVAGFLMFLSLPMGLGAQTTYSTVLSPFPLQSLGYSPRAYAMGGAFTAVAGDGSCLFYNPAGLEGLPTAQVSLVHQDWIAGISQETFLAAFPWEGVGGFAFSVHYLDFGQLDSYDISGNSLPSNHPLRASFSLGWGGDWLPGFAVGLSATQIDQSLLPGESEGSTSFQAGLLWRPLKNLGLGASYAFHNSDLSPELGFLRLGASWSQALFFKAPLLLEADCSLPLYNTARLQFGGEQLFWDRLTLRAGYLLETDSDHIVGFRGPTAGLGFNLQDLSLDYSYGTNGDLGYIQTLGLTYRLPAGSPKPKTSKPSPRRTPFPAASLTGAPAFPASSPLPAVGLAQAPTAPLPNLGQAPSPATLPRSDSPAPPLTTPVLGAASPSGKKPIASTTLPALDFNPSATVSPNDRVLKVETRFRIPDSVDSPGSTDAASPVPAQVLEEAGKKVQANPQDAQAWMDLGNLYWESGQADYAVQCFSEVLRLKPDSAALKDWLNRYRKAHPSSPAAAGP